MRESICLVLGTGNPLVLLSSWDRPRVTASEGNLWFLHSWPTRFDAPICQAQPYELYSVVSPRISPGVVYVIRFSEEKGLFLKLGDEVIFERSRERLSQVSIYGARWLVQLDKELAKQKDGKSE
jgi:hypothetical protein